MILEPRFDCIRPITYLPFGPMTGMTYGNSKTFSASYDQDYRPTNRTVSGVFNHTYDTDDEGNITQKGSWTYGYDELNRLDVQNDGSTATGFTYDAIGNRLTENSTSYTYPSTSSKLSSVGSDSYTYDAMGNITDDDALEYTWSAAALLKEVKTSGTSTVLGTYTYDADNRRTRKVSGGNTVHYVYGQGGKLYGEYDNSGALIREYVWLNGEPLAQVDAGSPEVLTYLHTDHLATPRYGTDASGSTVWTWESGAFGAEAPTGSATVNLRFPGQYLDSETGLHYNWNRYYNPATGRYVSGDPIGLDGGLNLYAYGFSSPLANTDNEGLHTWSGKGVVPGWMVPSFPLLYHRYFMILFQLHTNCARGNREHATVLAEGYATTNVSGFIRGRTLDVEFDDNRGPDTPIDSSVFNGKFLFKSNRFEQISITLGSAKATSVKFTGGRLFVEMVKPGTCQVRPDLSPSDEMLWNQDVQECRK
ncbi:MAG: hypothetical protein H6858_04840 [Rhodospirillales bacterium]|nr:hypothetical protein [Rhodospirillales bacterium]